MLTITDLFIPHQRTRKQCIDSHTALFPPGACVCVLSGVEQPRATHTRLALTDGLHLLRTTMSFASKFFNKTVCAHLPPTLLSTHACSHALSPPLQLSGVRDAFSTPHTVYHDKVSLMPIPPLSPSLHMRPHAHCPLLHTHTPSLLPHSTGTSTASRSCSRTQGASARSTLRRTAQTPRGTTPSRCSR